jgi:rhodanese-related sulfurtransferase
MDFAILKSAWFRRTLAAAAAAFVATCAFAGEPAVTPVSQDGLVARQAKHDASLFVLDVRTPEEYAAGHVPGATNIPFDQVPARLAEVPKDKDVVLYCRSGRRAGIAADTLAAAGYKRLFHLEGDMEGWTAQARPVERPMVPAKP